MGRIYTTKMALRKALITVRLTIEPERNTRGPVVVGVTGRKVHAGLATPDSASGGRAFSAIAKPGRLSRDKRARRNRGEHGGGTGVRV
jgi:hypothetical protein